MIAPALLAVVQCPDCSGTIEASGPAARCAACGRVFTMASGVPDLRPAAAFAEQTKYLDDALHADARHTAITRPVLGSRIRNDMLRAFLRPGPGDRIIDLGCGSGRAIAWNADSGATLFGVDVSPHFAPQAILGANLMLGDLRQLPLRTGAFNKAWSLDVLEHLSPEALAAMLREAARVLDADGALFVYTHVRRNGPLAVGVRAINRLAAGLERIGWLDLRQERLRKSDHLNPLADHEELARVVAACGFRIERLTYYTPIVGAFMENVLARMTEHWLTRRARRQTGAEGAAAMRQARAQAQAEVGRGGLTYRALVGASWLMKLDILLFGRVRSGPFFALLRKVHAPAPGGSAA